LAEIGIGRFIEDHKSGINSAVPSCDFHLFHPRMTTQVSVCFKHPDIVPASHQAGCQQATASCSDDRDSHLLFSQLVRRPEIGRWS